MRRTAELQPAGAIRRGDRDANLRLRPVGRWWERGDADAVVGADGAADPLRSNGGDGGIARRGLVQRGVAGELFQLP